MSGVTATREFHVDLYPILFEDTKQEFEVDCGCVIADMIPAGRHAIVMHNNHVVPVEQRADVRPLEGDYVVIRTVPTAFVVAAIAAIGSAVAASAAAAGIGFLGLTGFAAAAAWTALSVGITIIGGLIQRSLIEPPKSPERQTPDRLPGISGQSNRIDPFGTIDKIYGTVPVVPKLGAKPYTEIAGDDQYLRMLLVVGIGPIDFDESDIYIGNTPLTNFTDYEIEIRNGWPSDTPVTLFTKVVDEAPVGAAINSRGDQLIRTTEQQATRVSVDFIAATGLQMVDDDDGSVRNCYVGFVLETSPAGQNNWTQPTLHTAPQSEGNNLRLGDYSFSPSHGGPSSLQSTFYMVGSSRNTIRGSLYFDTTDGQYDVRITRTWTVEKKGSSEGFFYDSAPLASEASDITWSVLRSFIANDGPLLDYPVPLATISLRMKATDQLNGVIDDLSVRNASGLIAVPGQGGYVKSSNPAWQFRDALIGRGGKTTVPASGMADLSAFADFCDARGYAFDAAVNPADRYSVISQILSFGRGSIDMSDGKFGVIYEHEQPRKQLYTPRNSWNFSGNRQYPKIPHALRTQYLDLSTAERNEVTVYRDGYNKRGTSGNQAATEFEQFDVSYGCADVTQAVRMAHEKIRETVLRSEVFKLTTGFEWMVAGRGGRVGHAHDAILVGLGSARITMIQSAGNDQLVSFDQTYEMAAGKNYGIEVRDQNAEVYAVPVVTNPGVWDTVTVIDGLPVGVAIGDLVAFGEINEISQDLIVKTIAPQGEGSAELELIPYAPEIYDISQPLPEYDAHITGPVDIQSLPPRDPVIDTVRSDETVMRRNSDGSLVPQIVVVLRQQSSGGGVPVATKQARYRKTNPDPGQWSTLTFERNETIILPDVVKGVTYDIEVRNVSPWARYSNWVATQETVIGNSTVPPDVTGLTATFENFAVRLDWDSANVIDVSRYVIEQDIQGQWQPLDVVDKLSKLVPVLPTEGQTSKTYQFRVKAQDSGGLVSANWTTVSLTVNAPLAPTVNYQFDGPGFVLSWDKPATQFPVSEYIVRRSGVIVDSPKTNVYRMKADWLGDETWSVSAVDVADNEGPETEIVVTINAPQVQQAPSQIISNNVLLYWTGNKGSLPIDQYEISVGDAYATAELRGTSDSTFKTLFEAQAGSYTYWVVAVDTAGNHSTPSGRTNVVTEPQGFKLYNQFVTLLDTDFTTTQTLEGTVQSVSSHTNAMLEAGGAVLPVNTTETIAQHFDSRSWNSPQDQINAGYPLYIQPTEASGTIVQEYDCGTVIAGSKITTSANVEPLAGTPDVTFNLQVKEQAADPWTDLGASQAYTTNFRYIQTTLTVSQTGDKALVRVNQMRTDVNVQLKQDQGTAQISTNPTTILFNEDFIDIQAITVTIADGSSNIAVYDFTDTQNPTGFDVYVYDLATGNPANAKISWTATGN